tara:strand:+ start:2469 stop:3206 length:738 start_codon:yes stop_codon:yes gene_type:complete
MIVEDFKLLFVHIPRTGGSSVEKFFNYECDKKWRSHNAQHCTLEEYSDGYDLDDYFKFTIVRNPWDRLLSWYLWSYAELIYFQHMSDRGQFVSSAKNGRARAWIKGRKILTDKNNTFVDQKFFLRFKTAFSSFVERLEAMSRLGPHAVFDDVSVLENRLNGRWIMPQVRWLEINSKIKTDYICKFEKLKINFNTVLRKNNIKKKPLEVIGRIYHKPSYRKFYTKKNQQIIANIYAEDIKKFKYEF